MDLKAEVERVVRHLHDLIEDSDVPRREIDDRLGHSRGYLGQLLAGTVDLKYWHLISILEAIGCSPQRFLEETFPLPSTVSDTELPSVGLQAALSADQDLIGVYGIGIDAVRELRRRLERCETSLEAADASPPVEAPPG